MQQVQQVRQEQAAVQRAFQAARRVQAVPVPSELLRDPAAVQAPELREPVQMLHLCRRTASAGDRQADLFQEQEQEPPVC